MHDLTHDVSLTHPSVTHCINRPASTAEQTLGRLDRLSHALAVRYFGTSEESRRRELILAQDDGDDSGQKWDWFGSEGNWRQEKEAVRQENRELMHTIRSARNYKTPTADE